MSDFKGNKQTDNTYKLANHKILPLLIRFAIPATTGTVVNATYNVVDRIFIGRAVGESGLAAITVSFPIMMIMMAFGMMFGYGSCSLVSIKLGEGNKLDAERLLGQAFALYTILSVVFTIFGLIYLEPLLRIFGASEKVMPLAKDYMTIILIGIFVHEISFGINSLMRGEGNTKAAMVTMLIGAGINIVLDPIFLFVFSMGVKGAAIATVIAQTISMFWVLHYYMSGRSLVRLRYNYIRIYPALTKKVIATGSPMFLVNTAHSITHAIIFNSLGFYGSDTDIAVMGIIFTLLTLIFMPMIGITQGAQPIIGFNHGAKRFDRVRQTVMLNLKISTGICLTAYVIVMAFPKWIFVLFSPDENFSDTGAYAVRRFLLAMPLIATIFVTSNYFQSVARPKIAVFVMLRHIFILMPAILILPKFWAVDGIWYSGPISDVIGFIIALVFMVVELKKLNEKAKLQPIFEIDK